MSNESNIPFEDQELQTAWIEWEQHRKEKRQKLTPLSVKKQLKFLQGRSKAEIIAIIDQSIMNGWTGLFELKTNGKQTSTNKHQQHTAGLADSYLKAYGSVLTGGTNGRGGGTDAHQD